MALRSLCVVRLRSLAFSGIRIVVKVELFELFGALELVKSLRNSIVFTDDDIEDISELLPDKNLHFSQINIDSEDELRTIVAMIDEHLRLF